MSTTIELMKLANFLNFFRKELVSNDAINFVDSNMCVLNETYYIKITDDGFNIRSAEEELELSKDFYYYETLESIFEDTYEQRKVKKTKVIKRVDFLLKRVMKEYNKSFDKEKESSD